VAALGLVARLFFGDFRKEVATSVERPMTIAPITVRRVMISPFLLDTYIV
jgi:hypothetical protein